MLPFSRLFRFCLMPLLFVVPAALLQAQTTWKGRDGDWDDVKSWSKPGLPPLQVVAPVKKATTNSKPASPAPATPKPGAVSTAPSAAAALKPLPLPAPTTPATPNVVVLGGGLVTWHADRQGDFSLEVPLLMTKKAGWKQTGGPAWIFVRNGGNLTVTDAVFDGGTSENLIVGETVPGHVLVSGPDAVLTLPEGEIKLRRNATFTLQSGNVSAKLISFDDMAEGTQAILTLAGGTLTLTGNGYGGVYGGGDHHYINFPTGSKAVLVLTAIESEGVYEQLEKGGIRYNQRVNPAAFKVDPREGSGCKITIDPLATP